MAKREQFEASVLPHMSAMLRAAAALVGLAEAEDAAQEAMTRAWQAWPGLRDVAAVRPWLLRITVNVCREWRRGSFGRGMEHTRPLQADEPAPSRQWARLETDVGTSDHTGALDLRSAIETLDEALRIIVVLRYYGGMDATVVGQVLDMPPATVRTRLHRALGQLRERLGTRRSGTTPAPEEEFMSDTPTSGAMPPELEPLHRQLLRDSTAWSMRLPSTERLRAHTKQLTSGYGGGTAEVATMSASSQTLYEFGEETMEDTEAETGFVRTSIRPLAAPHSSRMRSLFAAIAAAAVVLLLAGTLYALSARSGGIGGQGSATPTPGPATGVGIAGPQGRFVPSAVAALGFDATGAPVQQGGTFDISHLIYVVARVQGVAPGETHTLTIRWYVNGQLADLPNTPYTQTVTSDGYVHFVIKLAPGAATAKLYWDLPTAEATDAEASLAQTVTFVVVLPPTVAPGSGATPTPAPNSPYIPTPTLFEPGTPTSSSAATPTPQPVSP